MKNVTLLMLALLAAAPAQAAGRLSWSTVFGAHPVDGQCVRILPGAAVVFDEVAAVTVDTLWIEGGFEFQDGADRTLRASKILVDGQMRVGRERVPFTSEARLELSNGVACTSTFDVDASGNVTPDVLAPEDFEVLDAMGMPEFAVLLVRDNGVLDLHGLPRQRTWQHLVDAPARSGDDVLTVLDSARAAQIAFDHLSTGALPRGWQRGDEIVIASTDFDMTQAEVRTIANVVPTGSMPAFRQAVTLTAPLDHLHWAGRIGTHEDRVPDVVVNAEIGLLTHNIKIYDPAPSAAIEADLCAADIGLHHDGAELRMITSVPDATPLARIEYVEVRSAGKYGRMGRYPIHFHEVGVSDGSYVRGVAVRDSSNRAIVLHGTQGVLLENNVAYNMVGHAYYLERTMQMPLSPERITAHNTLVGNLGLVAHGCSPLDSDVDGLNSEGSAVFYFEDNRNVLIGNAAAGASHSGFYHDQRNGNGADGIDMNEWHLCGDAPIDYAIEPGYALLDTSAFDWNHASYTAADYELRGFEDGGAVRCHGTFAGNSSHSAQFGFWSEQHKTALLRLLDFTAYKHERRAVLVKNKGFTEVVRLRAADNSSTIWPASHAYHMGTTPRWLVIDSHIVGQSDNVGDDWDLAGDEGQALRSLPLDSLDAPVFGVEVYEGHLHVANTFFEMFDAVDPGQRVAAFGRHQSFPFYSNNPDNSVQQVKVRGRRVYFDSPSGTTASGEASVMIHDLDGSLAPVPGSHIVSDHDFVVPGQASALGTGAYWQPEWNAHVVTPAGGAYAQLIVRWCDAGDDLYCDRTGGSGVPGPSRQWDQQGQGRGAFGDIMGLDIRDLTECAGACTSDVLGAEHSVEGVHSILGGNVLSGHDYEVTFWRNENWGILDPQVDEFDITAMEVHLRYAPVGAWFNVSVPVHAQPVGVRVYRGEDQSLDADITANNAALPTSPYEWFYDGTRVHLQLDAAADYENASILMIF